MDILLKNERTIAQSSPALQGVTLSQMAMATVQIFSSVVSRIAAVASLASQQAGVAFSDANTSLPPGQPKLVSLQAPEVHMNKTPLVPHLSTGQLPIHNPLPNCTALDEQRREKTSKGGREFEAEKRMRTPANLPQMNPKFGEGAKV